MEEVRLEAEENSRASDRLIVALDTSDESQALAFVRALRGRVKTFKVGLELLSSCGVQIIPKIVDLGGQVFVDCKFMDIPNTVSGASRALCRQGVKMFSIHSLAGRDSLLAAVEAVRSAPERKRPLVLAVTILTSIDKPALNQLGIPGLVEEEAVRLTQLALDAGVDGVIASPQEVSSIRQCSSSALIVAAGVRPWWSPSGDQRRVATPAQAISSGATHIVVGRPIVRAPESIGGPLAAVNLILDEIQALEGFA